MAIIVPQLYLALSLSVATLQNPQGSFCTYVEDGEPYHFIHESEPCRMSKYFFVSYGLGILVLAVPFQLLALVTCGIAGRRRVGGSNPTDDRTDGSPGLRRARGVVVATVLVPLAFLALALSTALVQNPSGKTYAVLVPSHAGRASHGQEPHKETKIIVAQYGMVALLIATPVQLAGLLAWAGFAVRDRRRRRTHAVLRAG
ncbi:MAG: hypothetical protein KDE22_08835 [Rhodobacterales bacterium]|nr:hypothetical protein [Rhodobacterales bacterium]